MEKMIKKSELSMNEGWVGVVYCLCIDMILSTEAALKRSTQEQNKFNTFMVKQLVPHLKKLALDDVIIQYTGDGWLVMTENENKLIALCCFAMIMSKNFQKEMGDFTGFGEKTISPLRLAICPGLDMCVRLPDGSKHWVGDSARRAVRASGCCHVNEILVDASVLTLVSEYFDHEPINTQLRQKENLCKKMEETLNLHTLLRLTPVLSQDVDFPEWIYTLDQIGRKEEAIELSQSAGQVLMDKIKDFSGNEEGLIESWNLLLDNIPDYKTATYFMEMIQKCELKGNIMTYNSLIDKAPDMDSTHYWIDKLKKESITPNLETYNILIEKSPDYPLSKKWFDEMEANGIKPNSLTFDILIPKTLDNDEARILLGKMSEYKILPNFEIYITLIQRAKDYLEAQALLDDMEKNGIPPNVITYSILVKKVSNYDEITVIMDEMEARGIPTDIVF